MNLPFNFLNFYIVEDILEVCIIGFLIYQLLKFLHTDRQKNLLLPFYSYCFLIGISYLLYLKSLIFLLIFFAPIIIVAIILLHQDILQKNFIATRYNHKKKEYHHDWAELLFKACLHASLNGKTIHIFIQRADNIEEFLTSSIQLDASINYDLLVYLLNTMPISTNSCILIDHKGIIKGLHATWHHINSATWQDFTQIITEKNDAVGLTCISGSLLFEVIHRGKRIQHLSATQALRVVNHCLKESSLKTGALFHDMVVQESATTQQINS